MLITCYLLAAVLPVASALSQSLPGRLAGTVVDFRNRPIAGVEITAVPTVMARTVESISDADGRFTMELPPGGYVVSSRKDGYGPARGDISVMSNAEVQLTVPLFRLVRVNPPAIMPPRKLAGAPPQYPEPTHQAHLQHDVVLDVIVGSQGTVTDVKVLRGHALLNQAAIDAVARWRYMPTVIDGEPVDVQLTVSVSFPPHAQPTGGLRDDQIILLLPARQPAEVLERHTFCACGWRAPSIRRQWRRTTTKNRTGTGRSG